MSVATQRKALRSIQLSLKLGWYRYNPETEVIEYSWTPENEASWLEAFIFNDIKLSIADIAFNDPADDYFALVALLRNPYEVAESSEAA